MRHIGFDAWTPEDGELLCVAEIEGNEARIVSLTSRQGIDLMDRPMKAANRAYLQRIALDYAADRKAS